MPSGEMAVLSDKNGKNRNDDLLQDRIESATDTNLKGVSSILRRQKGNDITMIGENKQKMVKISSGLRPLISEEDVISKIDDGAEQSRFWNINMACIIAWKAPINANHEMKTSSDSSHGCAKTYKALKDRALSAISLCIFRFLPIFIVLAEVVILISILDEGCKLGYLISGDDTFQSPTFNWPEKPESTKCDAAALLHDWLQEPDESAGEAPACLLYAGHLANLTAQLRFDAPNFPESYSKASQGVEFSDSLEWVQVSRRIPLHSCMERCSTQLLDVFVLPIL